MRLTCARFLATACVLLVSALSVSCQNTNAGNALAGLLDELVVVNGQPFSQGMARLTGSVKEQTRLPSRTQKTKSAPAQPTRTPAEEAERDRLLAELDTFRSNLSVGDAIIYYETIWHRQEVLSIRPEEVSVKWNSSFRSANRVPMDKVFPGSWEISTIKKTLDKPNIARATVDHHKQSSSEAALNENYENWKTAKAAGRDSRRQVNGNGALQVTFDLEIGALTMAKYEAITELKISNTEHGKKATYSNPSSPAGCNHPSVKRSVNGAHSSETINLLDEGNGFAGLYHFEAKLVGVKERKFFSEGEIDAATTVSGTFRIKEGWKATRVRIDHNRPTEITVSEY